MKLSVCLDEVNKRSGDWYMSRLPLIESELRALPEIDPISLQIGSTSQSFELDCLRLDRVHPFVSGNKWYKLQHHLHAAERAGKTQLLSFGGAYSNHLHALAYAGYRLQMPCIGLVRGELAEELNPTLHDCSKWGMTLKALRRDHYRHLSRAENRIEVSDEYPDAWIIPEGGEGREGMAGIEDLFGRLFHESGVPYDVIVCPVGSGTTLAGIVSAVAGRARVVGFSALKGAFDLEDRVEKALGGHNCPAGSWEICHDYHFGGFGKQNERLTQFISSVHAATDLLLDPIYTGKMLFGVCEWARQARLSTGSRVLMVHTGGLQGWRGMGGWPIVRHHKDFFSNS